MKNTFSDGRNLDLDKLHKAMIKTTYKAVRIFRETQEKCNVGSQLSGQFSFV